MRANGKGYGGGSILKFVRDRAWDYWEFGEWLTREDLCKAR